MGLTCLPVDVEIDISRGQTNFTIVGLADTAIKEAKDRIHSAIKNSGYSYPFNFRLLVNLAPADSYKVGSAYDVPMAVGIILISNDLLCRLTGDFKDPKDPFDLQETMLLGELALDGSVRHVAGVLPLTLYAKEQEWKRVFVPVVDAAEAALVEGITIFPVNNLQQLVAHLIGQENIIPYDPFDPSSVSHTQGEQFDPSSRSHTNTKGERSGELDMEHVKGQAFAKRALEIAASGAHNLLMCGPPGSGKTLLARTLPSILPQLNRAEALEVTKIYSVAGLLQQGYITERPFRTPHHTASGSALIGGGLTPRPGEVTLAHRGVLFLDEFPEFKSFVIEHLRQPLEDGVVTISRSQGTHTFPARFILVASQNPCPCGYAGDMDQLCICSAAQLVQYRKKISGPLLDRIDLHVEVPRIPFDQLASTIAAESSNKVRSRVVAARAIQAKRFQGGSLQTNSEMRNAEIEEYCELDRRSMELLRGAVNRLYLSARAYHRILKLSRTIADLADNKKIQLEHVAEALQFRPKAGK